MADTRCYRGYVVLNPASTGPDDKWLIRFPDFPDLTITAGNEALNPAGIIAERCCTAILNTVLQILQDGRQAPTPQEPIQYPISFSIDIDIDALRTISVFRN